MVEGQRAEDMSLDFLTNCRIRSWILPNKSDPFSMRNYYGGAPFFSPRFIAKFKQDYQIVESRQYFSVWACRSAPGGSSTKTDAKTRRRVN